MPPAPLVSVVIPAYNQAAYLRGAIDSVLANDDVPLELVVVVDGSSKEPSSSSRRAKFRPNRPIGAARPGKIQACYRVRP